MPPQVALTPEKTEQIIKYEVQRAGTATGYDFEDMMQEARIAAERALSRVDPSLSAGLLFARTTIRRTLARVKTAQRRQKRVNHASTGEIVRDWSFEAIEFAVGDNPEASTHDAIELKRLLAACEFNDVAGLVDVIQSLSSASVSAIQKAYSDPQDRLRAFVGILQKSQKRDRTTWRNPMTTALIEPVIPTDLETPECHAEGAAPQGYDKDETSCQDCPDKFSCLKKSIDNKITDWTLDDDGEVWALWTGRLTYAQAIQRLANREKLNRDGEEIPESASFCAKELFRLPVIGEDKKIDVKKPTEVRAKPAPEPAPRKRPKSAKPKNVDGRTYRIPQPKSLTPDEMREVLARVDIGQTRKLKVGYRLVRQKKDGREVVVEIRETGFAWNGKLFSSLSSAVMNAEQRCVSGNDFFSLKRTRVLLLDAEGNRVE